MFDPGMHWMKSPKMGVSESKAGKPYLYIEGEITHRSIGDGESSAVLQPGSRTIFLYVSEAAAHRTFADLDRFGWNGDVAHPMLANKHAEGMWVEVFHDKYEGKIRDKVQLPGGGGIEHAEVKADTLRALQAAHGQYKANNTAPPLPVAAPVAAPGDGSGDVYDDQGNKIF